VGDEGFSLGAVSSSLGTLGASIRASDDNVRGEGFSLGDVSFSIGTLCASVRASDNVAGEGIFLGAVGTSIGASDTVGGEGISLLVLLASLLVLSVLLY